MHDPTHRRAVQGEFGSPTGDRSALSHDLVQASTHDQPQHISNGDGNGVRADAEAGLAPTTSSGATQGLSENARVILAKR